MFSVKTTTLPKAGVLNDLVKDYINQRKELAAFYGHFPNQQGFADLISQCDFNIDREQLASILLKQSESVNNTSAETKNNIALLKDARSFTITTGHQLCLFTGPLYFIYKIFSVINLCEELNTLFPAKKFVPVYWAASEDHDFEEVNHFNAFNKTIKWESSQVGAVGDFKTSELESVLEEVKNIFGTSSNGEHLTKLFKRAYLEHNDLSHATRFLVNELFGQYGLVIVDGNDAGFKKQFVDILKKDIFKNTPSLKVNESISALKNLGYEPQVNPRAVNCFYIEHGSRARIERTGNDFTLVGTSKKFTEQELTSLIENEPEKISPNVVLRPLYQQTILPNIAYVGGPGELAYWLEYKNMFDELEIIYPILVPRSFITVIDKSVKNKMDKLGFEVEDVFKNEQELIKLFRERSNALFDLDKEKEEIEKLFVAISSKIEAVDKTLTGNVSAERQKALASLDAIAGKANRAIKQRSETELNQVKFIKDKLFPGKIPQERHDNFSAYFIKYGNEFFNSLKAEIKPLSLTHLTLIEE
jgi:bacillithiol biosynthesis cysteine-adding enzyme BshC